MCINYIKPVLYKGMVENCVDYNIDPQLPILIFVRMRCAYVIIKNIHRRLLLLDY